MFKFLLKRKFYITLLFSGVVATATMVVNVSAANTLNTAENQTFSNLHELTEAHNIVKDLKNRTKQFFSKRNNEPYSKYLRDLEIIMGRIRTLINVHPASTPEKDRLILDILHKINFVLNEVYKTLNRTYREPLTLAQNLQKTIKLYASPAEIKNVQNMVAELKAYLNPDEATELDNMIKTIESMQKVVPSSKFICLARISKRLKRR